MRADRTVAAAALIALTLTGAWLRLPILAQGITPDEFVMIVHANAWTIFWESESGVNPPLLRVLFNVLFEEPGAMTAGRGFSWLCGTLAIPLAFEAGRRATGGSLVAGLTAAVLVTFHPYSIRMSGRFRAYAPWMFTMGLHLVALHGWRTAMDAAQAAASVRWRRVALVTAILLPWLHYQSVPLLLLLGAAFVFDARWRPALRLYAISGLIVSPMSLLVLTGGSARVPHRGPLSSLMAHLFALDFQSMPAVTRFARTLVPAALVPRDDTFLPAALVVGSAILVAILLWARRRLSDLERVLLYGTLGLLIGSMLLSWVQLVRTPTVVMILVFAAPLLAAIPQHLPFRWARPVASILVAGLLLNSAYHDILRVQREPDSYSLLAFSQEYHDHDDVRGDLPIYTWPQYTWVGMYYYLQGHHVTYLQEDPRAACGDGCFEHEGVQFHATERWAPGQQGPGIYAAFDDMPDADLTGCIQLHEARWYHVWLCGTGTP